MEDRLSIIRNCVTCLKGEDPCYKVPDPAPLPKSRVVEGLPFQTTGVDNFGPLFIRKVKKAELSEEIYVCLFTCAVTQAVHLELVEDLSADAFLKAFRRYVSRRGVPKLIISDNAKKTLNLQLRSSRVSQKAFNHQGLVNIPWIGVSSGS